ncbi:MAG: Gfo/Idh/MocA family oxidoreductase [bacterium]|nr:Gfo/Idh/MocA family oxidoreductase [bacterium]
MLKTSVIGVGSLGQHHARIYAGMKDINLVAVVDSDEKNGKKQAKKYKATYLKDYHQLVGKVDAVSIAVPTPLHFEVAKFFLENKIHCLVEKPITVTLKEADTLISLAEKNGVILQVGHIERFNPAILHAQNFLKNPRFIEINRLGPYSPRVSHVGVVLDLMVHDLDMVLFLTGSKVTSIDAVGTKVISGCEDIANVRLHFESGCVANISASRVSLEKLRKIRVFQDDSYISLNYEKQDLKVYQKKSGIEKVESLKDITLTTHVPKKEEPLFLELRDYIDCIKASKPPKVDGLHGRAALALALEIVKQIEKLS